MDKLSDCSDTGARKCAQAGNILLCKIRRVSHRDLSLYYGLLPFSEEGKPLPLYAEN